MTEYTVNVTFTGSVKTDLEHYAYSLFLGHLENPSSPTDDELKAANGTPVKGDEVTGKYTETNADTTTVYSLTYTTDPDDYTKAPIAVKAKLGTQWIVPTSGNAELQPDEKTVDTHSIGFVNSRRALPLLAKIDAGSAYINAKVKENPLWPIGHGLLKPTPPRVLYAWFAYDSGTGGSVQSQDWTDTKAVSFPNAAAGGTHTASLSYGDGGWAA